MAAHRLKVDCRNCGLYRLCLARGLGPADREQLESIILSHASLGRGECVFSAGDAFHSIYAVRSGAIKTSFPASDGHPQISGFHLPGELLGLEAISDGRYRCTAEAMERSDVCEIPYERFEQLASRAPELHTRLQQIMSSEIGYARRLTMLRHKKSTRAQLAVFLLNLSSRLQQRGFSAQICRLSMSRKDLANYLGVSVETVCRLFARLQADGILRIQKRSVHLLDLPALRNIAGLSAE
jgi:CRP/FNR family transcriptional regulator, anaerobic regulatory protein